MLHKSSSSSSTSYDSRCLLASESARLMGTKREASPAYPAPGLPRKAAECFQPSLKNFLGKNLNRPWLSRRLPLAEAMQAMEAISGLPSISVAQQSMVQWSIVKTCNRTDLAQALEQWKVSPDSVWAAVKSTP